MFLLNFILKIFITSLKKIYYFFLQYHVQFLLELPIFVVNYDSFIGGIRDEEFVLILIKTLKILIVIFLQYNFMNYQKFPPFV